MALANISLDLLGQARHLYTYAGKLEGRGHDEDLLRLLPRRGRLPEPLIVEQPNGDFAVTMARQVLTTTLPLYWESMRSSTDETLAALAARAVNETRFHLRHSTGWLIRLGDGTDESHRRAQAGLDTMWPFAESCSAPTMKTTSARRAHRLASTVPGEQPSAQPWPRRRSPCRPSHTRSGGLHGEHSEHLAPMLEVMQGLARAHPGATW